MRRLTTLFPSEFLGVVERSRTLQIPVLVWALVFGSRLRRSRTLAGFRRSYNATADEPISPGGFYQRLTPSLAECLCDLVETALDEVTVPEAVNTDINRFRDVMIADGTVLRLHEFHSDEFQARHEEQAGAKLHYSTMLQNKRLNDSTWLTKKRTMARWSRRDRGCTDGSFCLI